MILSFSFALSLVAAAAVAVPAFAGGGGGGGGSKSNYRVRVKNNGTVTEAVSVTQGSTPSLVGSKTLSANQVGQWSVKKGSFVVAAYTTEATSGNEQLAKQAFNAGAARNIYALAAIDGTVGTVTGSKSTF